MRYNKEQDLNTWMAMLKEIYGATSNYSKSEYEIFSHLTEVTLAFGKLFFKKKDIPEAVKFLPKMFSWTIALILKVKREQANLETIILTKFPSICPYCTKKECGCTGNKIEINSENLRSYHYRNSSSARRGLNDFQLMFKSIYNHTWRINIESAFDEVYFEKMRLIYLRLTEELSEISEAIRFYHLYPTNFDNEMADFIAWWFAVVSCIPGTDKTTGILAEELVWDKYPGICKSCLLERCDCRPGPVREMLSKPSANDENIDRQTLTYSSIKFSDDIKNLKNLKLQLPRPIVCIKLDLDNLKEINSKFSLSGGDRAIQLLSSCLRAKIRSRDRLYRGAQKSDEFSLICPDFSALEAKGMIKRIQKYLTENFITSKNINTGVDEQFNISFTAGISECLNLTDIETAFEKASATMLQSKKDGKNQVNINS